jgi:hypothetical protein
MRAWRDQEPGIHSHSGIGANRRAKYADDAQSLGYIA